MIPYPRRTDIARASNRQNHVILQHDTLAHAAGLLYCLAVKHVVHLVLPGLSFVVTDHGSAALDPGPVAAVVDDRHGAITQRRGIAVTLAKVGGELPFVRPCTTAILGIDEKHMFVDTNMPRLVSHLLEGLRRIGRQQGTLATEGGQQFSRRELGHPAFRAPIAILCRTLPRSAPIRGTIEHAPYTA